MWALLLIVCYGAFVYWFEGRLDLKSGERARLKRHRGE